MARHTARAVTLVHDYLLVLRGAERTFAEMAACWPRAPISTLLYDSVGTEGRFAGRNVTTSYLQHLGVRQRGFRALLPLFPFAAERLALEPCDLLVSSSSAFAHGVRAPAGATHVCYCHSPFRYVWHERDHTLRQLPRAARPAAARLLSRIRTWDRAAAGGVDHIIANSQITRTRIQEFWGRDARVVHPPVDTDRFALSEPEDYLVVVCELVGHKRVDAALEAARRAGRRMKVVGTGPELKRLRTRFGAGAEFLGRVDDRVLADVLARSLALVVPNVEEFGIAAVEAQAAGRPVVGPAAGGTAETVLDGKTGVLVAPHDDQALAEALRGTDFVAFDSSAIREHARAFRPAEFRRRLMAEVDRLVDT